MKTFLKIAALSVPLFMVTPSFAQIRWGVDLHIGVPAPREVIVERPYADAIWVPGYYNYAGYRQVWVPGFWRHPHYWAPERREGFDRGRDYRGRDRYREDRHDGYRYSDRGHDGHFGRER